MKRISNSHFSFAELKNNYLTSTNLDNRNLESFVKYLIDYGYSTAHAQELFDSIMYDKPLVADIDNYSLEKSNKGSKYGKRVSAFIASFLASFAISTAITSVAISLGTIAGMSFAGIEVMGNFWKTLINPALIGAGISTVIATGYALSKTESRTKTKQAFNYMNKAFALKYGTAKTNLKDYLNQLRITSDKTTINIKLDSLLNDITNECERNVTKKHGKLIFNTSRDKIHYLEYTSKQLLDEFYSILSKGKLSRDDEAKLVAISDILNRIDATIKTITEDYSAFTLIDCGKKSNHKHTLRGLDIFANLNNYHTIVCENINPKNTTNDQIKSLKLMYHKDYKFNQSSRKQSSDELLKSGSIFSEEDKLVSRLRANIEKSNKKNNRHNEDSLDKEIHFDIVDGKLIIKIAGKQFTISSKDVDNIKDIHSIVKHASQVIVIYNNGSTIDITNNLIPFKTTDASMGRTPLTKAAQTGWAEYLDQNPNWKNIIAHDLNISTFVLDQFELDLRSARAEGKLLPLRKKHYKSIGDQLNAMIQNKGILI